MKSSLVFLSLFSLVMQLSALTIDPIYQSHMVLQQGKPVPVTGSCTSSNPITVTFGDQTVTATIKDNKWVAQLAPMSVNATGQALRVTQNDDEIVLNDVLVGEVWLASGQSNMEWRLNQTGDKQALSEAPQQLFRFYHAEAQVHVRRPVYTEEVQRKVNEGNMYEGSWMVSAPGSRGRMSAVAWYFGKALQEKIEVPVGVIHVSLGGSEMLAWMPEDIVEKNHKDCQQPNWQESKRISIWASSRGALNTGNNPKALHPYKPSYLFNHGISPWVNFPIAGVIWYQGESDAEINDSKHNTQLLKDLINSWRSVFHSPKLPFLMVQLPRIKDYTPIRAYWPEFREVQQNVADEMPQVYCSVTIDLGTTIADVHPPRKVEVGGRLAAIAAVKVYGKKGIPYSGPVLKDFEKRGNEVLIRFNHAKGLKTVNGNPPVGFEVSTDGKTYVGAETKLTEEGVVVSHPQGEAITHVRYAWFVFMEPNLVNQDGLPTAPFNATL